MNTILIAEDSDDDFLLIRDAFKECGLPAELLRVKDGEELTDYLFRRGPYEKTPAPRPELILLDLKMPKKNGLEALAEIKKAPSLRHIPVVALSTSGSEQDIRASYDTGVNAYVRKPIGFQHFVDAARVIHEFWLGLAKRAVPRDIL